MENKHSISFVSDVEIAQEIKSVMESLIEERIFILDKDGSLVNVDLDRFVFQNPQYQEEVTTLTGKQRCLKQQTNNKRRSRRDLWRTTSKISECVVWKILEEYGLQEIKFLFDKLELTDFMDSMKMTKNIIEAFRDSQRWAKNAISGYIKKKYFSLITKLANPVGMKLFALKVGFYTVQCTFR